VSVLGLSGNCGVVELEVTGSLVDEELEVVKVEDAADGAVPERSQGFGGDATISN